MRAAQISGCSQTRENTQNRVQRFYIHTNLIKFVIAHFKLENRSMSCTFQLICIASLLAFSTFILVFMQNCRDCRFSNSEMTPMLPLNTRYDKQVYLLSKQTRINFNENLKNFGLCTTRGFRGAQGICFMYVAQSTGLSFIGWLRPCRRPLL